MTNVTLYPCWTALQAAEANPSADAAAFVSQTSALYQYANHTSKFWSQSFMFLLLLFQGTGTSHCSELLFVGFLTIAAILLEYSNINSWGLFQGVFVWFFLVESKYFQVFSYQRDLSLVNSESNLNCIPCQSLLIWVAVGARRPHMFWQVNGEMIWETARQADTVIKQPARDSVPILWGNFLQNVPDLLSRRW